MARRGRSGRRWAFERTDRGRLDELTVFCRAMGGMAALLLACLACAYARPALGATPRRRWAVAAAHHFRNRGVLWEMYNEPNIGFWKPKPNVDDYIALLEQYRSDKIGPAERLESPIRHIHGGKPSDEHYPVSFALLLNLVSASNAHNREVLWGFIQSYAPQANLQSNPGLDKLVDYAIKYYDDFIKPQKRYRAPSEQERAALADLAEKLRAFGTERDAEKVQFEVYEVGKRHGFEPLRDWFKALYEVLFGQSAGPRFGSFAVLFGCEETAALIDRALGGEFASAA